MSARKAPIGIGIIGAGGIAQSAHMPGYAKIPDKCKIIAIAEPNETAAKKAAEKFGVEQVFSNYSDMLKMKEIDAVSVCTPNYLHLQPSIDALNAGKHVLVEKPMAKNGTEAKTMARVAKETGNILQVALNYRFCSTTKMLQKWVDEGNLGEAYFARAQAIRRRGIPGWGVFGDKEKQGGGPLVDIGVHILDFTLNLMGFPKPVSVSGKTYQKFGKRKDVVGLMGQWDVDNFTVEDFAIGLIRFDNGATVVLESSFCGNYAEDLFATEVLGTNGGFKCVPYDRNSIVITTEKNKQMYQVKPTDVPEVNSHHAEIEAFVDAVLEGKPSPVPPDEGYALNAIFDALYKSCETGKEEKVDLSL